MTTRPKRVLVTGADGFIGSHLCECLIAKGDKVRALTQYNSFNDWGWLETLPNRGEIEITPGDVRDPNFCRMLTKDIDVIYNLAALIAIPYSYQAPEQYMQTNAIGALNLCQGALDNGCERFIQMSTSEVYGTAQYAPIDEKHPLQAQSPYSASKIASDAVAFSYYNSFELPVVIARPFNTYGPRQSARAVIPTIITQIMNGQRQIKLGKISPTRDFNYVKDTCMGLVSLTSSAEAIGEVINLGSGVEISIGDLVDLIARLLNQEVEVVSRQERMRPDKSEVERLLCDNRKLTRITGFKATRTLEEGLAKTIEWFQEPANLNRYKAEQYNV